MAANAEDSDALVNELLIRFVAAYADQGFAPWPLPDRALGFFRSFTSLYEQSAGPPDRWLRPLADELRRLRAADVSPIESVEESLDLLGVPEGEWDEFLTATLLALRGWGGMLRQMEVRADRVPVPAPPGSMIEFLAVRLILDRLAIAHAARETLGYCGALHELRTVLAERVATHHEMTVEQRAFLVFQLVQVRGWSPAWLSSLRLEEWAVLLREIEAFPELERRRLFHLAFERRFRTQALDALSIHCNRPVKRVEAPRFQAVFCIDAREESFRRHLEEVAPDTETFGAAGFFGVAMYYRGVADAHFAALCPIVVRPRHWVVEEVVYTFEEQNRRRAKTRRALGTASHQVHVGSRSMTGGALLTAGLGVLASVPLVARVLFPRLTARILGAVVVVCSGINLQYFFSYIDSPGWGSGTKLPHNVTSLLGVMDGAASDLRMGLPWQGVEIHEPVRLLMVIEAPREAIVKIMERNPTVGNILRNGWVQLALLDPDSHALQVYRGGEFHPHRPESTELSHATSSTDWYRGYRDHLPFAVIAAEPPHPPQPPKSPE